MKPTAKRKQQRQNARDLMKNMPLDMISRGWLHRHLDIWTQKKQEATHEQKI